MPASSRRARPAVATWGVVAGLLLAGAAAAQAPSPPTTPQGSAARASGLRGASPAPSAAPGGLPTETPLALQPIPGGGDAAPLCRSRCAPAFYACSSGATGGGDCVSALALCRRGCDAASPPLPGRLQSPLPSAGLGAASPLRPLPGGAPTPQ